MMANLPNHPPAASDHSQTTRRAVGGMAWVTLATMFAKALSFLSQIVLGYVLAVETYGLFGITATALAFVAGFQNSGVSKALIQHRERFDELLPEYSAFSFQFSTLGALILVIMGAVFQVIYKMDGLFWVTAITALSLPGSAIIAILGARLSILYQFRSINLVDMQKSFIYYFILIFSALSGANIYTVALATVASTAAQVIILIRHTPSTPVTFIAPPRRMLAIFLELRWVVLSSFLFALAMRADFLVLGKILSDSELGFYLFGFMLVTNVTIPITAGINQIFLPIFVSLRHDVVTVRREFLRFSSALATIGASICIILVGLSTIAIHAIWQGKWDGAQLVINLVATVIPVRLLSSIAGVGFESHGSWRMRNALLCLDILILVVGTAIGAGLAGMPGAAAAAALQRATSGLINFIIFGRQIGVKSATLVRFITRVYLPYAVSLTFLFTISPDRHADLTGVLGFGVAGWETALALMGFLGLVALINRSALAALRETLRRRRRAPAIT